MRPRSLHSNVLLGLGLLCISSRPSAAQDLPAVGPFAPFEYLDNVEGDSVNLNAPAIRPMVLTADQGHLYAVNVHASRVVHFTAGSTQPVQTFHTPRSPVSIALWTEPAEEGGHERIVVACRDSYALAILDRGTGDIVAVTELRDPGTGHILGEPGDLLIDAATDTAYVSCAAADAVAEVALVGAVVTRVFRLPAKNPLFMCFDANQDVLVAPLLSGNNSGARPLGPRTGNPTFQHLGPTVVDFATKALNNTALPDEDLFRIVRSTGVVQPVTTGMGTIQFACGVRPGSNEVWQLNTEANNKDDTRQGEAAIRGDVVQNRVSIATLPTTTQPKNPPTTVRDLGTITGSYNPARSVGQPYGLWFATSGYAFVTGLLTDNVMLLSPTGTFVDEFDLAPGAIPRAVLYSEPANAVYVYCWGNNTIEVRVVTLGWPLATTLQLGLDPTPTTIREGRTLFYDASHSARNDASCASCHVEGRIDGVVWNLSTATDDKGPMTTQTLDAINRTVPFHWRAEQRKNLLDFNPAFDKLLGGSELVPADFAKFERFVLSLEAPPNPFEGENRMVDDSRKAPLLPGAPTGFAIAGQTAFKNGCEHCHMFPTGTGNDSVGDGVIQNELKPRRQFFKVAPFLERHRLEQDGDPLTPGQQHFQVTLANLFSGLPENLDYPLLGAGLAHAGIARSLHDFNLIFGGIASQSVSDLTNFVFQWDQGVAPATYRAVLLNQAGIVGSSNALYTHLVPQAQARHCDLVLFGKVTLGGASVDTRWWFDRRIGASGAFVSDDPTHANQQPAFFVNQALIGQASVTCVGLPVGVGEGFGIDFDRDDFLNRAESQRVPPTLVDVADTDGDTWPDGHEIKNGGDPTNAAVGSNDTTAPTILRAVTQMLTTKVARINVETDEPCVVGVSYTRTGGGTSSKSTAVFAKTHTLILDDLLASTGGSPWMSYTGNVSAVDHSGTTGTSASLPNMPAYNQSFGGSLPITTRSFSDAGTTVVASQVGIAATSDYTSGTLTASASVRVDKKIGGPPATPLSGHVVIARIFKNGVLNSAWTHLGSSSKQAPFTLITPLGVVSYPPLQFGGLDGPFLVSAPTPTSGTTTLDFKLTGLTLGDKVTVNLEVIGVDGGATATVQSVFLWNMPSTEAADRSVTVTF